METGRTKCQAGVLIRAREAGRRAESGDSEACCLRDLTPSRCTGRHGERRSGSGVVRYGLNAYSDAEG